MFAKDETDGSTTAREARKQWLKLLGRPLAYQLKKKEKVNIEKDRDSLAMRRKFVRINIWR